MKVRVGDIDGLAELLRTHPHVEVQSETCEPALEFSFQNRVRRIWIDRPETGLFGLVELVDNNPLVCADEFSLPSPEATLALIALGPLIRAGVISEAPVTSFSFRAAEDSVLRGVEKCGWRGGLTVDSDPQDLGSVLATASMAVIQTPQIEEMIDDLFSGIYGSCFFVRESDEPWRVEEVANTPCAYYRIRSTPGTERTLLTIQVMADAKGKCGAAQVVHAFNVMCGFEESLGTGPLF